MKTFKEAVILMVVLVFIFALGFGLYKYNESRTYRVYRTMPEGRVVLVLDPDHKRVDPISIDGLIYNEIWVAPDFDPDKDPW